MEFLKLLLNSGLFLGTIALTINENSESNHSLTDEGRLPYNVVPLHYDINLELFFTERIVTDSECKIYIQIKHPTQSISFHADLSQILEIDLHTLSSVNNTEFGVSKIYNSIKRTYDEKYHIISLSYDEEISSGSYVLHLTFRNVEDRNKKSLFKTSYINEVGKRMWLVATDFQAIGARKLFPCWDEPAFRATFNISIRHHRDYVVLSNMPAQVIHETVQPNMTWTVFERTPLMPTYHVSAIMIMHFTSISMGKTHIQFRKQLNRPYILFAISVIHKVMEYLKSQEKCFEKLPQIKHVVIPGFLHDTVTNLGLIYYRETAIIYDEEKDSAIRQTEIARLIGRTVAYQCFERTIPSWWSYMWLNEGIAMLLGMDAVDEAYPELRIKDYFAVQFQQESLRFDTDSIMKPLISDVKSKDLSDIDSVFSISYYIKAPVIMRMLQQILTNNVFRKGINIYLNKEASSLETRTDVLWAAMQTAYDETRKYNEERLNIKQIMDAWTKQQHYPVVRVIQTESFALIYTEMDTTEYNWWLPYIIATQMDPDFFLSNFSQPKMLNPSTDIHYIIEYDKWIIVNIQQIGYYRVNYEDNGWLNIVRYLNSDEYGKIHVLNRAQIIDDAFYFLMKGQLNLSVFLKLQTYLLRERDYIAWYPMIKAFEYMSSYFPFSESTYIKITMTEILDKLLKEIGYEEERKEPFHITENLREEAAKWTCTLNYLKCRKEAMAKLTTDVINKRICSSNFMGNEWITSFCNGLRKVNSWDWVLKQYIENSDYTILKFLACSDNFFNIRNTIELIALGKKTKDDVRIYIFHSIVARHAKNDTMLDYILANFYKIKPRNISATVALVDIINHVYSKEQLNKITEFLENYQEYALPRIAIEQITINIPMDSLFYDNLHYLKYTKIMEVAIKNIQDIIIRRKISLFKSKIEMRLFQIMRQKDQFSKIYLLYKTVP